MYHFRGGFIDSEWLGPVELVPPPIVVVVVDDDGYRIVDWETIRSHLGDGVVHYRRLSMAEPIDAQTHGHADYGVAW